MMKEFKSKEELKAKLDEIAQRMLGMDYSELGIGISRYSCLLEAKGVLTQEEHEMLKGLYE